MEKRRTSTQTKRGITTTTERFISTGSGGHTRVLPVLLYYAVGLAFVWLMANHSAQNSTRTVYQAIALASFLYAAIIWAVETMLFDRLDVRAMMFESLFRHSAAHCTSDNHASERISRKRWRVGVLKSVYAKADIKERVRIDEIVDRLSELPDFGRMTRAKTGQTEKHSRPMMFQMTGIMTGGVPMTVTFSMYSDRREIRFINMRYGIDEMEAAEVPDQEYEFLEQ